MQGVDCRWSTHQIQKGLCKKESNLDNAICAEFILRKEPLNPRHLKTNNLLLFLDSSLALETENALMLHLSMHYLLALPMFILFATTCCGSCLPHMLSPSFVRRQGFVFPTQITKDDTHHPWRAHGFTNYCYYSSNDHPKVLRIFSNRWRLEFPSDTGCVSG